MQESETDYVNRELNLWKVNMYSNNPHLYTIPILKTEQQKVLLIKQYKKSCKLKDSLKPLRYYYGISKKLVDETKYKDSYCNFYWYCCIGIFCVIFGISLWIM